MTREKQQVDVPHEGDTYFPLQPYVSAPLPTPPASTSGGPSVVLGLGDYDPDPPMLMPGPPGAAGGAGATGAQGPMGLPIFFVGEEIEGPSGHPGVSVKGDTGAQGPMGLAVFLEAESIEGQPGLPGRSGLDGSAGVTGAQGPMGLPVFLLGEGYEGPEGSPGLRGLDGVPGSTGAQGPTGVPLFLLGEGEEGPPGVGIPGPAGAAGAPGNTGAQGPTGLSAHFTEVPPGDFHEVYPPGKSDWADNPLYFIRLNAARTLPNNTSENAIFNVPANGTITLPVGTYLFDMMFGVTAMSATSGNAKVDILGAGTAVVNDWLWNAIGKDGTLIGVAAVQGVMPVIQETPASMFTAATTTELWAMCHGTFTVTTQGTLIPSIALVTAVATAVVAIGSFFRVWRIGDTGITHYGPWT